MAENGFLSTNDFIAYPLVTGASRAMSSSTTLPQKGLTDAGFMLGMDSGFIVGTHYVYLSALVLGSSDFSFVFTSDATDMSGYHWKFTFPYTSEFGCTFKDDARDDSLEDPFPDKGWGFVTVGDTAEILALKVSAGVGTYTLTSPIKIEPALVQSLVSTFVRTINLANMARPCYGNCSTPSVSTDTVFVNANDIAGDVRLREGFNTQILVNGNSNIIEIRAVKAGGDGGNCDDIIIESDGPDGVQSDDGSTCGNCDGFIKSINGMTTTDGHLQLVGGRGVTISADPGGHMLTVTTSAATCGS